MVQYFEKQDKTVLRLKNYVVDVVDSSPVRQLDRWVLRRSHQACRPAGVSSTLETSLRSWLELTSEFASATAADMP